MNANNSWLLPFDPLDELLWCSVHIVSAELAQTTVLDIYSVEPSADGIQLIQSSQ